jgi:hypothetical protein
MESSAATCSTSTSISSPPRAAAKFIEPVEILPHRLQSKDCLPVLQGVSPPPKPQRLQSVEDLTSRTSDPSSGESIPVHDANLPSLPSIPQRRCSLISTDATSTGISALTPLGMESSTATCSTSTSISDPPRAATKFEKPLEILPHRMQSKDCLPVLQGVSPPPKPQRLQSVEDLTSRTSESTGESMPVHDANLPSLPSIPQRRCSLIL